MLWTSGLYLWIALNQASTLSRKDLGWGWPMTQDQGWMINGTVNFLLSLFCSCPSKDYPFFYESQNRWQPQTRQPSSSSRPSISCEHLYQSSTGMRIELYRMHVAQYGIQEFVLWTDLILNLNGERLQFAISRSPWYSTSMGIMSVNLVSMPLYTVDHEYNHHF